MARLLRGGSEGLRNERNHVLLPANMYNVKARSAPGL
jgi:hypothetical protein